MPDTTRHPAIAAFLSQVDGRLRNLPAERREAERDELAQHLDLLAGAYAARGMDADAAADAAIERFGRAERIGADLAKAGDKTAEYVRFFAWYAPFIVGAYLLLFWSMGDPLPRRVPWVIVAHAVLVPSVFILTDIRKRRRAAAK